MNNLLSEIKRMNALKLEAERLGGLVEELAERKKQFFQTDIIEASSSEFPYTKFKRTITGYDFDDPDIAEIEKEYQNLKKKLLEVKVQSERAYLKVYSMIYEAPDPVLRQALEYRFICNMEWSAVAAKVGNNSPDSIRKAVMRYLSVK